MSIQEPRINAYGSRANPLMIIGILLFISPFFIMGINGYVNGIVKAFLFGAGILFFIVGVIIYLAENM